MQNKIDFLDELSVVQICATNFTDCEVEAGKSILYELIPDGSRCVQRKREDKKKKNIKDVIKLFKETHPTKQPSFVAKNLDKLPPVTFDHVDVSRLLKDIAYLKAEIMTLRNDSVSKFEMSELETKIMTCLTGLSTQHEKVAISPQQREPARMRKSPSASCTTSPPRRTPRQHQRQPQHQDKTGSNPVASPLVIPTRDEQNIASCTNGTSAQTCVRPHEPVFKPSFRDIALLPARAQAKTAR